MDLTDYLAFAVPVEMMRQADLSPSIRLAYAKEAAAIVPERGDVIQFSASGTAKATAALIRGLAALAYQPGGVTFAGHHWCTDHSACEAVAS